KQQQQQADVDDGELSTHTIQLYSKELDADIIFKVWDFRGSEVTILLYSLIFLLLTFSFQNYHGLLSLYFSERSLYLVVWNMNQPISTNGVMPWVKLIRSCAPKSPIILVGTHSDEKNAKANMDSIKLTFCTGDYPNIKGSSYFLL